jgi:anti-sigma-K factor RskA
MNVRNAEQLDAIAGEYVLGTLGGRARQRFERLALTHRIVADAIRAWEDRLLPLAEALPPIVPPSGVWTAIVSRIGGRGGASSTSRPASVGWWRGLALAGLAMSLALAVVLLKGTPERPEGNLVIVLAGQDAKPAIVATATRAGRYLSVKALAPLGVAPDRALELWMLPDGGNPRSLGIIPIAGAGGIARVELPAAADQALQSIPALAVSLEPAGGSPTGLPTGPVLYTGQVQRLY